MCSRDPAVDRHAHIGVHEQKQPGLNWIGVVLPVGKLTVEQMRGLAALARDLGDGDIRLTVWQNLLISGVPTGKIEDAKGRIIALGLDWQATSIRAGLVACTGSTGCRFAGADTKGHAEDIARWCEERVTLDSPVNIHLTGCHHSCAQHYIGDIGLIGAQGSGERGGRYRRRLSPRRRRRLWSGRGHRARTVAGHQGRRCAGAVERLLKTYLSHRVGRTKPSRPSRAGTTSKPCRRSSGELAE